MSEPVIFYVIFSYLMVLGVLFGSWHKLDLEYKTWAVALFLVAPLSVPFFVGVALVEKEGRNHEN